MNVNELNAETLLARVQALKPVLRGRAEQTDRDRRVGAVSIAELGATGLFRALQPRRYGGLELGFSDVIRLNLAVASGCGSTGWCAGQAVIHNWIMALFPTEAQDEVWANPDSIIASSYLPVGKCEPVEGGYRISGQWPWASNCDNAEWFMVGAMLSPSEAGSPPTPLWLVINRNDAVIQDSWYSAGLSGTGSKTIVVDTPLFVPIHRALPLSVVNSTQAPGSMVNANPMYRLTFAGAAPFSLSSLIVGMALGAVETFEQLARERKVVQMGGPPLQLNTLAHVQIALAEAAAEVDAATTLLLRDVAEVEATLARGDLPDIAMRIRNRRDQAFAARLASAAVNRLFEALGANVGMLSHPVQRAWRDVNVASRHISMSWPIVGAMYSQHRLGLEPRGTY
jgi:alkylation response protein AidB-like acyl-CoA dehydrogenase